MGISDFYKVVNEKAPHALKAIHLSEIHGAVLSVDVSIFLNKFIKSSGEIKWMNQFFMFLCLFKKYGIKLICIFDGPNAPKEKLKEREKRREQAKKTATRLERAKEIQKLMSDEYMNDDKEVEEELSDEAKQLYGKPKHIRSFDWSECFDVYEAMNLVVDRLERASIVITKQHNNLAKEIVTMMGIPYFQADGEAEGLCSSLAVHKYVDGVFTEDTDVIAYGTPWLVALKEYKLSDEMIVTLDKETLLEEMEYTQERLRDLCILLSCDYNERVKGFPPDGKKRKKPVSIGLKGAISIMDECESIEEAIQENYIEDASPLIYKRCREIFTPPSGSEMRELIKHHPLNEPPDEGKIKEFIDKHHLTVTWEYIEQHWKPTIINFESSSESEGENEGESREENESELGLESEDENEEG